MAGRYTPPWSSYQYSVNAYQPIYEPPTSPQSNNIQGSSPMFRESPVAGVAPAQGAAVVRGDFRRLGMRYLYSRGARVLRQFVMTATGQVPSSQFQNKTAWTWDASFNDALFQAGYPGRNLGISEKVPTIPPAALGTQRDQMMPAPRFTRTIFTNRSYGPRPGLPAIPTNGQRG